MRGTVLSEDEIWGEVSARVNAIAEYRERFETVYGEEANQARITQAIAAFESTLWPTTAVLTNGCAVTPMLSRRKS